MENTNYSRALEEAITTLHRAEMQVFTALVNVGFNGVYEGISQLHEVGEVLNLEIAMFEHTDDLNLEGLAGLVKQIAAVRQQLINLNTLKPEQED